MLYYHRTSDPSQPTGHLALSRCLAHLHRKKIAEIRSSPNDRTSDVCFSPEFQYILNRTLLVDFRSSPDDHSPVDRHCPDVRWMCVSCCFGAWWIPSDRMTGGLFGRPVQSMPLDVRYYPDVRQLQYIMWFNGQFLHYYYM